MAIQFVEIDPRAPFIPDFAEAWRHRAVAFVLAWRNVKVRFKQTVLGSGWYVIQPLMLTGVLSVFVGGLLNVPSDGIPYALFAFTGTAIWTTFQRALNDASVSFVNTGAIISKVYFPRLLVPISSVITAAIDFVPLAIALLVAVIALGVFPGWPILAFPFLFLLILTMALSVGLWVTVLDSILRDLRFFIPYGMQMVFYACPIMYSATIIPERWQALYRLNPLVSILEGFRWSLVAGAKPPGLIELAVAILIAVVLLLSGLVAFARLERIALDRM